MGAGQALGETCRILVAKYYVPAVEVIAWVVKMENRDAGGTPPRRA
jgi:hypothetical protein